MKYIKIICGTLSVVLLCMTMWACAPQDEPLVDTYLGQEWYLSKKPRGTPIIPELTSEQESILLSLPVEYSQTIDGVTLQLDFFKESYRLDEIIQLKITVTNNSEREVRFDQSEVSCDAFPGAFRRKDGEILGLNETCGWAYDGMWVTDDDKMRRIAPGESITYECFYRVSPDFFYKNEYMDKNFKFQGKLGTVYEQPIYTTMSYTVPVEVIVLPEE